MLPHWTGGSTASDVEATAALQSTCSIANPPLIDFDLHVARRPTACAARRPENQERRKVDEERGTRLMDRPAARQERPEHVETARPGTSRTFPKARTGDNGHSAPDSRHPTRDRTRRSVRIMQAQDGRMALSTAHVWPLNELFVAEESATQGVRWPTVYLDTSVVSYLTARLNRSLRGVRLPDPVDLQVDQHAHAAAAIRAQTGEVKAPPRSQAKWTLPSNTLVQSH